MWQRSWLGIRNKFKECLWSVGKKILGKGRLCWMTGQFSYQQQRPTCSPTQYCVWEETVFIPYVHGNWFYELIPMSRNGSNRREPMEFECKIFPGFTTLQILAEIRNMMTEIQCEPWAIPRTNHFHVNVQKTLYGVEKETKIYWTLVVSWAWIGKEILRTSHVQTEWKMGSCRWGHDAQLRGHPVFRGSSAVERGALKSKGKGTLSIHFCGGDETVEAILRTIISVNQLQCLLSCSGYVRRNWSLVVQKVRRNLLLRTSRRPLWCQQNCRQRTKRLGPLKRCKETCCTSMNENSQIFQIIFNWSNCAPMQVSCRLWRKDSFSRPSTMRNLDKLGGSRLRVHKTLRRQSVIMKTVTELRSWSTSFFAMGLALGWWLWTE